MRALRFNLQNRARVIESLKVFEGLCVDVDESESFGLTFTIRCFGDRNSFNSVILSCIPLNWNYTIFVNYDSDCNAYPVLFCFEKNV